MESWEGGKVELMEIYGTPEAKLVGDPVITSSECPVIVEMVHTPWGKPAPFPSSFWATQLVLKPQIPTRVLP